MNGRQILRAVLIAAGWLLLGIAHQLDDEPRIIVAAIVLFVVVILDSFMVESGRS